jgi:broad specificity phosphatase PhoE
LEWIKDLPGDRIVLVSHGGIGRMVRTILRGEDHDQINSLARMGNAELFEFQL